MQQFVSLRVLTSLLAGLLAVLPTATCNLVAQAPAPAAASVDNSFMNPLLGTGADPWVTQYKGMYYYMNTTDRNLTIWATPDITDLRHATRRVVWTPPPKSDFCCELWAPELHRLDHRWYIYFTADRGSNESHRIWVIENSSEDPLQGTWTMKGEVDDASNRWAIDPSVFEANGQKYILWSGWPSDKDGEQDIYIAHLKNPWTIDSDRVLLSSPQYPWERVGDLPDRLDVPHVDVNEGPEMLQHGDDLFLVYSASACWTDNYSLGVLHARANTNLLDPHSWQKYSKPFFRQDAGASAFGTGHNGFFKSPDGKEDWIIYHANPHRHEGCEGARAPRIQPFTWNADGTPDFGKPWPVDTPLTKPSGTAAVNPSHTK